MENGISMTGQLMIIRIFAIIVTLF